MQSNMSRINQSVYQPLCSAQGVARSSVRKRSYNSNKQEPLKKKRFKRSMYLLRVYKNISCVLHIMHYLLLCVLCTTDYWLLTVYKKNRTKPKKTQKNPKTKNIRCFINCSPNTVKHKRTKIYTIPYKVYLFCVPFLQFQPLTTLKLNYRPLSSLKKSENMAKLQDKKKNVLRYLVEITITSHYSVLH